VESKVSNYASRRFFKVNSTYSSFLHLSLMVELEVASRSVVV
jgi:hypothetical protein